MKPQTPTALVGTLVAAASAASTASPEASALDRAFAALRTYDAGASRAALLPIDEAASGNAPEALRALETRLLEVLSASSPTAAKEYICIKLTLMGSAQSVPALAKLLADPALEHSARAALQTMPAAEAAQAMRDALPKAQGNARIGLVNSLGARRDAASVPLLKALLKESDAELARAAIAALGNIGNTAALEALEAAPDKEALQPVLADALLACAEAALRDGRKPAATGIYKRLSGANQPKHVKLAATRGLLSLAQR